MRRFGLGLVLLLAGCTEGSGVLGKCAEDGECPIGAACRISPATGAGVCVCTSDMACADGEICNSQGVCQRRNACRSNADCEASKFCDFATGICIDRISCGSDVHCLPGSVCEAGRCTDGCHFTGDCPLYTVCEGGGAEAIGRCVTGVCDDKTFCEFGSNCQAGMCSPDPNPNYCKPNCGDGNACGPRDFCLVNPSFDPNNPRSDYETYCGVECDASQPGSCPNGYACTGVVLLTQDQCTNDNECGGGGRECAIGEGDLRGFCTCVDAQDCAFDEIPALCLGSCGGFGVTPCTRDDECITTCEFTCLNPAGQPCTDDSQCQAAPLCQGNFCVAGAGGPCNTAEDCLCANGSCINTGRPCNTGAECNPPCLGGGCYLGDACGPEQGLLCTDVR
jgi:hypothetical protein